MYVYITCTCVRVYIHYMYIHMCIYSLYVHTYVYIFITCTYVCVYIHYMYIRMCIYFYITVHVTCVPLCTRNCNILMFFRVKDCRLLSIHMYLCFACHSFQLRRKPLPCRYPILTTRRLAADLKMGHPQGRCLLDV